MAKRGRTPDHQRREQAARLRRQGLTLEEIGKRLGGISRQAVWQMLVAHGGVGTPATVVRCKSCRAVVTAGYFPGESDVATLCPACLEEKAEAPFGVRLRTLRLAAGLSQILL